MIKCLSHQPHSRSMEGNLRRELEERCRSMDIPMMGVAPVEAWDEPPFRPFVSPESAPRAIMPNATAVVVIGIPLPMPAIDSAPSIWYADTYRTVNQLLDQSTYRLSLFLESKGHAATFVPRDGYAGLEALRKGPSAFFSHRHAAVLAGLGTFGVNNAVLTREYGPRVRFASLLTDAPMAHDRPIDEDLCIECGMCRRMCPVNAVGGGTYPDDIIDKGACIERHAELDRQGISPCGMCIRVCPVGDDRKKWGNEKVSIYTKDGEDRKRWDYIRSFGGK